MAAAAERGSLPGGAATFRNITCGDNFSLTARAIYYETFNSFRIMQLTHKSRDLNS